MSFALVNSGSQLFCKPFCLVLKQVFKNNFEKSKKIHCISAIHRFFYCRNKSQLLQPCRPSHSQRFCHQRMRGKLTASTQTAQTIRQLQYSLKSKSLSFTHLQTRFVGFPTAFVTYEPIYKSHGYFILFAFSQVQTSFSF